MLKPENMGMSFLATSVLKQIYYYAKRTFSGVI